MGSVLLTDPWLGDVRSTLREAQNNEAIPLVGDAGHREGKLM